MGGFLFGCLSGSLRSENAVEVYMLKEVISALRHTVPAYHPDCSNSRSYLHGAMLVASCQL